jgi:hypothetical protein
MPVNDHSHDAQIHWRALNGKPVLLIADTIKMLYTPK